jgi:hypothetical protein
MGETTFSHGMNGNVEAWMSSNQGQLTELAVEGAADRGIELAEAVVEKVQEHREKQRMSRYKPVYKRRPTPMPHNRAHYHGSFAVRR